MTPKEANNILSEQINKDFPREPQSKELIKECNRYIDLFEIKHDIEFDYWCGNNHGGVAAFGDYFFNYENIKYDIDNDIKNDLILDWHDYILSEIDIPFKLYVKLIGESNE